MFARPLLLACMIAAASPAAAVDSQSRAEAKGWGVLTCQQFLDEMGKVTPENSEPVARAAAWLDGYITAVNIMTPNTFDIAPWQDPVYLLHLIGGNCQKAPNERFITVILAMTEYLGRTRFKESQSKVVAQAPIGRMPVYKSILRDVQKALVEKGHLKGTVDGEYGPMTRSAIEAYQKAENIPVTGLPDSVTVERLLYPPRSGAAQPAPAPQPRAQPQAQPQPQTVPAAQ